MTSIVLAYTTAQKAEFGEKKLGAWYEIQLRRPGSTAQGPTVIAQYSIDSCFWVHSSSNLQGSDINEKSIRHWEVGQIQEVEEPEDAP